MAQSILRKSDEVRTFPTLEMAPPAFNPTIISSSNGKKSLRNKSAISTKLPKQNGDVVIPLLPGLLKTAKPPTTDGRAPKIEERTTFVGFNASNLKLDGDLSTVLSLGSHIGALGQPLTERTMMNKFPVSTTSMGGVIHAVNLGSNSFGNNNQQQLESTNKNGLSSSASVGGKNNAPKVDPVMDELRNFTILMDKYSLHNFVIYDGIALRETPEFQSFKRTFSHDWGSISAVIEALEKVLQLHEIRLAIINGPKLFEIASLNLPNYLKEDLLSCISNIEQVVPQLKSVGDGSNNRHFRAAVKIQCMIRRQQASRRVKKLKLHHAAATRIQSHVRLMTHRIKFREKIKHIKQNSEYKWEKTKSKLYTSWTKLFPEQNKTSSSNQNQFGLPNLNQGCGEIYDEISTGSKSRLLIYIPSISSAEYLRLELDNFQALQNTNIACLYQLVDPDVSIVYVSPVQMSASEAAYHDRFLAILGISTLPKRLHFIVPEMLHRLPQHLSLCQSLLCSPQALRKLKVHISQHAHAFIIPSSVGWAQKKIANILDIPLLSPDPEVVETLSCRSFSKRIFMDSLVNIPVGAHDINNIDDIYIALSRLISSNLDVKRWIIRLNHDYNNESTAYLDTDLLPVITAIRNEQENILNGVGGNLGAWYNRPVQLNVRTRLMATLQKELQYKIKICRSDIYQSWEKYLRRANQIGVVIEAHPLEPLGFVSGLCFIDPTGKIQYCGGVDLIVDKSTQVQSFVGPQSLTPTLALQGAVSVIAEHLNKKYGVIGYISIDMQAFWDSLDKIPRLWAQKITFGMNHLFCGVGASIVAGGALNQMTGRSILPRSLVPSLPGGLHFVHIPFAIHTPLRASRDDVFFKLCRLRGISFDIEERTGTLFFLIDTIVSGAISILCVASSRRRSLELAKHTLTFVAQQLGKESKSDGGKKKWESLSSILLHIKDILKKDEIDLKEDAEKI